MAKTLVPALEYKEIAMQLVDRYPQTLENVNTDRILFWSDVSPRKKKAYAYMKRVDDHDKMVNPNYDFHFVVNDVNVKEFTPAQVHVLVLHELMHVGPTKVDDAGNETIKSIDHDVKEFYAVIASFGIDWTHNEMCRDPLAETIQLKTPPPKPGEGEDQSSEVDDTEDPQFV